MSSHDFNNQVMVTGQNRRTEGIMFVALKRAGNGSCMPSRGIVPLIISDTGDRIVALIPLSIAGLPTSNAMVCVGPR